MTGAAMRTASLDHPPLFALSEREGAHLTLTSDTGAVAHIFVLEHDLIRLCVLPDGRFHHLRTWTIAPHADEVPEHGRSRLDLEGFSCPAFDLDLSVPGRLHVETPLLALDIGLLNLSCTWSVKVDGDWQPALADRPTQAYDFGWWDGQVRHYLARSPGEQYFGLGERSGTMDRAGRRFELRNIDAMGYDARSSDPLYKHIPFYITRKPDTGLCVGVFYDTLSDCVFDFGAEHSNYHGPYRSFSAPHGDLDLYVMAGPAVADVVRRFTWLTGRPMETPDWALGYSGSTMSYTDAPDAQVQMQGFLGKLQRYNIPCSSFHLSSGYTSIADKRYVFHWNRDKFPDPEGFVQSYAEAGVKLIANIKPALLSDHPHYRAAAEAGLFLSDREGQPVLEQFWDAPGAYLDFTNAATVTWWKAQISEHLLALGVAATWNDNNEFEVSNPRSMAHGFGHPFSAAEMKPLQTLLMLRASKQAQVEHAPDAPPFLVCRAGFAGMQRYAQTWSGDNYTSWDTLKWNIRMGLGLALSGVSNTGHDVGGFAGPRPDPELFLRWIGAGLFMPRFSIHSWNSDGTVNEPWMYPDRMEEVQDLMRLRQEIIPHIREALDIYRNTFKPAIRPIFHDFPDSPGAFDDTDDYLLGERILVTPVVQAGLEARTVRLPEGTDWRCGWSGELFASGSVVSRPAPLNRPPYFLREDRGQHPQAKGA
jgi:alpha-glucosidase